MKFENSTFEERYNDYWNKHVVALDKLIRNVSLGFSLFDNNANIPALIEAYQQHVRNILANLARQAPMFEDKEYVQQYIKNTIAQATEDLNLYGDVFPKYKNIAEKFIETIGLELPEVQLNKPPVF